MPLYEYECEENGHTFELIRRFSDPALRTCIKCKSKVKKLLSAPAIAFKGSGWYVTDYAKGGNGSAGSSRKAQDSSGSESKSSESKPSGSKPSESKPKGDSKKK